MKYQAVIFDLDGTLLNTQRDIADAANRALVSQGLPAHPLDKYREFVGSGVRTLMMRALPPGRRDEATLAGCIESFRQAYARGWDGHSHPYPGIPALLNALAESRIRLAVLSNKPHHFTSLCVEKLLPEWKFDRVLGQREGIPHKPDPTGALEIAEGLGLSSPQCVYVGDSGIDMETARTAEMYAVGVTWGFRPREELLEHGAQTVIDQPGQLLRIVTG